MARTLNYEMTIHARTCHCDQAPMRLGRTAELAKAVRVISGYWNVYLAFFGDQLVWLHFQVTDIHTGRVVWHNGRATLAQEEHHGIIPQ